MQANETSSDVLQVTSSDVLLQATANDAISDLVISSLDNLSDDERRKVINKINIRYPVDHKRELAKLRSNKEVTTWSWMGWFDEYND